jgi:hypothetical protein
METFSYKSVEKALAAVHLVPPQAMGAFRGRLQHFQRLGMVPSSPGRGRRISYEKADILLWAFGLELAEFGMDPSLIKRVIDANWLSVKSYLLEGEDSRDRLFFFSPNLIGEGFPKELQQTLDKRMGVPFSMTTCVIHELSDLKKMVSLHPAGRLVLAKLMSRYGIINLTHVQSKVEKALLTE